MHHPKGMGATEVQAFLTMLAAERQVSSSTHNQALAALLFLYKDVLGVELPWMQNIQRPQQAKRIPSVLTQAEVAALLAPLQGTQVPYPLATPQAQRPTSQDHRRIRPWHPAHGEYFDHQIDDLSVAWSSCAGCCNICCPRGFGARATLAFCTTTANG
jgi:hypothetical protein